MKENGVNIERREGGYRLLAWLNRHTPFALETWTGYPRIPWVLVFVVLFFGMIWRGYTQKVDMASTLDGNLGNFVYSVRAKKKPRPEILVCGSSLSGCGIDGTRLQRNLKMPVGKVALNGTAAWEAERILRQYRNETKNVKVVLLDLADGRFLEEPPHKWRFQKGNTFHFLKDVMDISSKNISFVQKLKSNELITNRSPFFLPLKFPLRSINDSIKNPAIDYYAQKWWTRLPNTKEQQKLKKTAQKDLQYQKSHLKAYSHESEDVIKGFIHYCQSRNIFVVIHTTPVLRWAPPHVPTGEPLTEADHHFLAFYAELESMPNCALICLRTLREIKPREDDTKFFGDRKHMTKEGATVYTNWLADQMRQDPKIAAALKAPRKREEFFVKKYAKQSWQTVAGYFKPSPPEHNLPDEQPIRVAEQPESVRR